MFLISSNNDDCSWNKVQSKRQNNKRIKKRVLEAKSLNFWPIWIVFNVKEIFYLSLELIRETEKRTFNELNQLDVHIKKKYLLNVPDNNDTKITNKINKVMSKSVFSP